MAATFAAWTRLKNDETREQAEASQSSAPLRFVTYAPEYLADASCLRGGNSNNCRVYERVGAADAGAPGRFGALTNRRELMRESTHLRALGVPTAPHQGNGPLLAGEQLAMVGQAGGEAQQFCRSVDTRPSAQPVLHQTDLSARIDPEAPATYAARLPARDAVQVSSRVERRQRWAESCARRASAQ